MPGMSGVSLGRAIRALRTVPVLYMSGYSEEVVSGKERLPPELFLQKPFERGPLLERVRAILAEATRPPATHDGRSERRT
jgi:DNA-binding response OmpR family regulator